MRKIIVYFIFISLSFGQDINSLTILTTDGSEALPKALLGVEKEGFFTNGVSDEYGMAGFSLEEGIYKIDASLEGYKSVTTNIEVDTDLVLTLVLENTAEKIEVSVMRKKANRGRVISKTTITHEDFSRTTQFLISDALRTLQTMPGVSSSGSVVDNRMYIQGGAQWEWIASLDGTLIMHPDRLGGFVSMFNPLIIDTIDLYTAGYPVSLGQGLSGSLVVSTLAADRYKWHGSFETSLVTTEGLLGGPLNKKGNLTMLVHFRRTYYDKVLPVMFELLPFFTMDLSGVEFPYLMDGTFKLNWDITEKDTLAFLVYGSYEGLKWDFVESPPPGTVITNAEEAMGREGLFDDGGFFMDSLNMVNSISYERNMRGGNRFFTAISFVPQKTSLNIKIGDLLTIRRESGLSTLQLNTTYLHSEIDSHKIEATLSAILGLGSLSQTNYFSYFTETGEETNESTTNNYDNITFPYISGSLSDDWEIVPSFIMQAGVRAEYFSFTKDFDIAPRGGFKVEANDFLDIFLRGGLYNTYPFDISMVDSQLGNSNIRSDKCVHSILGVDFENKNFIVRAEGFYKYYYDIAIADSVFNITNGAIRHVGGGDFYLQKKSSENDWIVGWLSYTYVFAKQKIVERSSAEDEPINSSDSTSPVKNYYDDEPPKGVWYTPSFVANHTISAILQLRYPKNNGIDKLKFLEDSYISFDFRANSGKPYTPVTNALIYTSPSVDSYFTYLYDEYNSANLPFYHKLDIKLSMPYSILSLFNLIPKVKESEFSTSSYITFINVYNRINYTSVNFQVNMKENGPINVVTQNTNSSGEISRHILIDQSSIETQARKDLPFFFVIGMTAKF